MATVLVVDDRKASREIARATLDHGGYQVIEASDGHHALQLATSNLPDLVLTDLLMPGMDGYQFVRELRSRPGMARMPVLFYTGNYREDEAHPLATAFGVSKILSKDASPPELLDAVAEALGGRVARSAITRNDLGALHDQTINAKLMEMTQALGESQARLAAMAEASPLGIALVRPARTRQLRQPPAERNHPDISRGTARPGLAALPRPYPAPGSLHRRRQPSAPQPGRAASH